MQEKIHPKYYPEAVVTCACGETFKTGSTLPTIKIEICSKCHPFFTGKVKVMDTAGRIEKFQKKHANVEIGAAPKKKAPKARKEKAE
ncbi:MAG: 50S ribosomal protein L31 [Candidatus Wallbacteria bacterium]